MNPDTLWFLVAITPLFLIGIFAERFFGMVRTERKAEPEQRPVVIKKSDLLAMTFVHVACLIALFFSIKLSVWMFITWVVVIGRIRR